VRITRPGGLWWGLLLSLIGSPGFFLSAQSSGTVRLQDELHRLGETVKIPQLSPADRQEALIRMAKLLQLTGNFEGAAQAWKDAAAADPQNRQDHVLLERAFCLVAIGEMDQAETQVQPLLRSPYPAIRIKARYLSGVIKAFHSGEFASLLSLLDDPDYEYYWPGIYYTLWKLSGREPYKTKLLSAYPQSPEARIVTPAASGNGPVSALPLALWLLFPGRDQVRLEAPLSQGSAQTRNTEGAAADQNGNLLQVGLFSKETNAQAMAARLKAAGFEAAVTSRLVKGSSYWTVTVPAGTDIQKTMRQLQDQGFESFPSL
jgi:tetratricopeptide (TPR) repeat protein